MKYYLKIILVSLCLVTAFNISAQVVDATEVGLSSSIEAQALQLNSAAAEGATSNFWNIAIAAITLAMTWAVAGLAFSASRQWRGGWRLVASAPLLILALWSGLIVISKLLNPSAHALWPFELFIWSMLTAVYMMVMLMAKKNAQSQDQQPDKDAKSQS